MGMDYTDFPRLEMILKFQEVNAITEQHESSKFYKSVKNNSQLLYSYKNTYV